VRLPWWDEGTCPMGDARFAKAENVEVEWDSRVIKRWNTHLGKHKHLFAPSWYQVYPQHHLPFPFALPLTVREISIPILRLWLTVLVYNLNQGLLQVITCVRVIIIVMSP